MVLGFDFGQRRIGVATGQTVTQTANPLETIHHTGKPDWNRIQALLEEWRPLALIVGLPLDMDGAESDMTRAAQRFGRQLHGRFGLPVHYVDERLSSVAAEAEYAAERAGGVRKRKDKAAIDAIAAKMIVETWLREQPDPAQPN